MLMKNINAYPLNMFCNLEAISYEAEVTKDRRAHKQYIGITGRKFKERLYNYMVCVGKL